MYMVNMTPLSKTKIHNLIKMSNQNPLHWLKNKLNNQKESDTKYYKNQRSQTEYRCSIETYYYNIYYYIIYIIQIQIHNLIKMSNQNPLHWLKNKLNNQKESDTKYYKNQRSQTEYRCSIETYYYNIYYYIIYIIQIQIHNLIKMSNQNPLHWLKNKLNNQKESDTKYYKNQSSQTEYRC